MGANFIYQIENGRLICGLAIGECSVRHTVNGWHDGLQELLEIACRTFGRFEEATAYFQEEPGTFLWRVTRLSSNRIRIRIVEYDYDWWASPRLQDSGKSLFDQPCGVMSFAKALHSGTADWLAVLELVERNEEADQLRKSRDRLSGIFGQFDFSRRD